VIEGVLNLATVAASPRSLVGGKAQSLGRLIAAAFPVPPGFVIATDATRAGGDPRAWPADLLSSLAAAYRALAPADERVAVRSSAVDEDGAAASFAGQYLTVLDVLGFEELLDAIARCLASLHSDSAVAYRDARSAPGEAPRMAVVVQRMVAATASGVAFSVDPVTGARDQCIVEAVAGLGEGLVGGMVEADRFVVDRPALTIRTRYHAGAPALADGLACAAAAAAIRAEDAFGAPQDIEFCFEGENLWLLQARPVTTPGSPESEGAGEFDTPTGPEDLWTSANVQEVLPGVLTPLTMSVFSEVAHVAYSQGYQRLKVLDRDEWPSFVGLFSNRAFLNVGAMRLIADRVFGPGGDAVEHRFLGGPPEQKRRLRNPFRNLRYKIRSAGPLLRMAIGIHAAAGRIERATMARQRTIRALNLQALSDAELEAARRGLVDFGASIFSVHLQSTGCAGAGFDAVAGAVRPLLKDDTEGMLPVLFTGLPDVESARIGLDLWELSRIAIREGLSTVIRAGTFDPAGSHQPERWRQAFAAFLERHGHRGLNEMEPAAKNWRADPAPVVQVVRAYLDLPEDQAPPATFARQREERLRLTAQLEGQMNGLQRRVFRFTLARAQGWVALRERTKSIVVRAMRLVDYLVPELQRRLVERGVIARPDDLFFLTNAELSDYLLGRRGLDLRGRVLRRRREFERNRHVQLPERFHGRPVPIEPELAHVHGDLLTGTPVSPGIVTGRARVILDPATDGAMQPGEILVAPVTDAGWTPLFALAAGLVVDIGSALSHGSTVAREYGLPAVVNVRRGTRSIRTGDLVTVNGTAGTVTVASDE
jgi:pyruvate,water dikinase